MSKVKIEARAIAVAALVVTALGFMVPSHWVMRVDNLSFIAPSTVVQDRTILVPMWARWTAAVQEITADAPVAVCSGSGDWYYDNVGGSVKAIELGNWVGETCKLKPGVTYRLKGVWRPRLFVWKWHIEATSAPFSIG